MTLTGVELSEKIKECYDKLPDVKLNTGAAEESDAAIADFRKERLKIATDCVFAEFGINRTTSERM